MQVVGIVGRKRSGKDTFASICMDYLYGKDYETFKIAFADALHEFAIGHIFWDYIPEGIKSDITDKPISYFTEVIKNSNEIFKMTSIHIKHITEFLKHHGLLLLDNDEVSFFYRLLDGKPVKEAYRKFVQFFGTDIVRRRDRFFWVDIVYHLLRAKQNDECIVFVPDVRFFNEAYLIKMFNGILVHVERPCVQNNDSHVSEILIDKIAEKLATYHIINRTISDLKNSAISFCDKVLLQVYAESQGS